MDISQAYNVNKVVNYSPVQESQRSGEQVQTAKFEIGEDEVIISPEALLQASFLVNDTPQSSESTTLGPPTDNPDDPSSNG